MTTAGTIERIWRYPIKSTGGELLDSVEVEARGLVGDRLWAVRESDGKLGSGKNGKRFRRMPELRDLAGRTNPGGVPTLLDSEGRVVDDVDAFLRATTGRDVALEREDAVQHLDSAPVSILSTATLEWMREALPEVATDERRFRPNFLVRTPPGTPPFVEETWAGRTLRIGEQGVRIAVDHACERCIMVNAAHEDLPESNLVLRTIAKQRDNRLMVLCFVAGGGIARVGDAVVLED
ncbi:MOSC domain-containing protein [Agromyces seonyuensis]|uniref:MOSC domain-containing protein n=1 Tax=Agromyces seonyuensis TaxID=2662446 RepID=A0A6I4NV91_9MICO|nr:MOSC N-terminal beta barrel domain-containing protein [Agromyces seonyuensis]MWB98163.1 MOSC domain-containing protein [Agromyces seonyuensis]